MHIRHIFLIIALVHLATLSFAQPRKIEYKSYIPDSVAIVNLQEKEGRKKYGNELKNELSFGFRLPLQGWGIFADYGILRRSESVKRFEYDYIYDTRVFTFELGEKIHPKEQKPSLLMGLVSPDVMYTYGKRNNFYTAKLMYNQRKLLAGKPDKNNISVHWVFGGGVSLGIQKPYYLNIAELGEVKYHDSIRVQFLSGHVMNRSMFKGFDEMEFIPGIILKNGFHFDFARRNNRKSAFEIGGTLEYYINDVNIMVEQKPQKLFISAYLSIQLGRIKAPGTKKK